MPAALTPPPPENNNWPDTVEHSVPENVLFSPTTVVNRATDPTPLVSVIFFPEKGHVAYSAPASTLRYGDVPENENKSMTTLESDCDDVFADNDPIKDGGGFIW